MRKITSLTTAVVLTMMVLIGCGGDDGSPTDDGNGGGGGTELFQNAENLWTVTDETIAPDYRPACDTYSLAWQSSGWRLAATFANMGSTCYNNQSGNKLYPFIVKELTVVPHFNVGTYTTAKLRWTESLKDFSGVDAYVSPDGGATWTVVSNIDHTSTTTTDEPREVEIIQYLGSARDDVRLRFVLVVGSAQFPRRSGIDVFTCQASVLGVSLTGYK